MNIFRTTIQAVIKRPFILIMIGSIMLAAAVFNAFIPLMAMIVGIVNMTGGGFFDSLLSVLQILIDTENIPMILLSLAAITVLVSAAIGILLPGFLIITEDGLVKGKKKKGLFLEGLKKYFFRFFVMGLKTSLFTLLLVVFLLVASVPAIIVTRAAMTSSSNLLVAAIFMDIVTIGVFFMGLSFFSTYIFMWYIAASKGAERPFKAGKAIADKGFWSITFCLLLFDIAFAAVIYLIYSSGSQLFRYFSGWVFTTAFFTTLTVYLVSTYLSLEQK
jgi:hypothetical protein